VREPLSQYKSSAADAQQSKDGAGNQRNLLRYCAAQQQLWGTHSCGKLGTRASDRTGLRLKAPREYRGKCGDRARQPRGPLNGCLDELRPTSACSGSRTPPRSSACRLTARHRGAREEEGTQGAPRKMRQQGAATPEPAHRVSMGVLTSLRLPLQSHTAPLKRLPPHRSPWRRQFRGRHCGRCPQPSLEIEKQNCANNEFWKS
jgi:hypothetical protein